MGWGEWVGFRIPPRVVGGGGPRAKDGSAGVMRGIDVGFGDEGFPGNGYEFTKVASEGFSSSSFSSSLFLLPFPPRVGIAEWLKGPGGGGCLHGKLSFRSVPFRSLAFSHHRLRGEWIRRGSWGSCGEGNWWRWHGGFFFLGEEWAFRGLRGVCALELGLVRLAGAAALLGAGPCGSGRGLGLGLGLSGVAG